MFSCDPCDAVTLALAPTRPEVGRTFAKASPLCLFVRFSKTRTVGVGERSSCGSAGVVLQGYGFAAR